MQLSDDEFVQQFEARSLDPIHFNHVGHLRLCWLYLQQYDLETAIEKICTGIQSYAMSLGANDKFHRTITEFLVRLIHSRVISQNNASFTAFLANNDDLVNRAQDVLHQFYSASLLRSATARLNYRQPDLIKLA